MSDVVKELNSKGKTKEDISKILNNIDKNNLRGENGENIFHILAKHTPNFLKEYIQTKSGISLMATPDNNGRYPIEYFMCFSDFPVIKRSIRRLSNLSKVHGWPKPDWLEVKMLVVENQAAYSGSDAESFSFWKQVTRMDFEQCLKMGRGQKFIKMAANDFKYKETLAYYNDDTRIEYSPLYGVGITSKVNLAEMAQTKDEAKLALTLYLLEACLFIYTDEDHHIRKIIKNIEKSIDKAASFNIDVVSIRDMVISSINENRVMEIDNDFHKFMCKKIHYWKFLPETVEKKRLMAAISLTEDEMQQSQFNFL